MRKGWEEATDEDRKLSFNVTPQEGMSVIHDGRTPDDELSALGWLTRKLLRLVKRFKKGKKREFISTTQREVLNTENRAFVSTSDLDINAILEKHKIPARKYSGIHTGSLDADRKLIQKAFKKTIKMKKKDLRRSRRVGSAGIIHSLEREIASLERQLRE